MSEWKEFRLGEIANFIDYRGKTPTKTTSGVPLITAKIVKNGTILSPTEFISIDDYPKWMVRGLPKGGDVVLTVEAPLGEVAQIKDASYALAQRIITIRCKEGIMDNGYLKYFLQSDKGQQRLKERETGTTVTGIKSSELKQVLIFAPDLPTQTSIAEILSSLDDKIELNDKINQELENLAQTLFKRWFIDFEFPNENGEPYKSSGGEMVESELGEMPKGWDVKSLEDIAELVRGISYRKHELVSKEDGVPFVNLKCFALDGTFRQDGLKYFSGKYKDSHVIQSNDILVAVTDLTQDRLVIGLPIVWQNEDFALPSLDVCIIRPHQKILKDFLFYEFKTHRYKSRIIEFANGSTVLHLSVKGLETYGIGLPSNDLLIQWSEIVNPILKSIGENTKENEKLSKLRDTLLTKLISGELEISKS